VPSLVWRSEGANSDRSLPLLPLRLDAGGRRENIWDKSKKTTLVIKLSVSHSHIILKTRKERERKEEGRREGRKKKEGGKRNISIRAYVCVAFSWQNISAL